MSYSEGQWVSDRLEDATTAASRRASTKRLLTFDLLRMAAMALVALQHLLAIAGFYPTDVLGFNPGQLGVTVFCGISGWFAGRGFTEAAWPWLRRRLIKIYPAYWICLTVVFSADFVTKYKPMSIGLVVSEYAGTAYFTHRYNIVGVHFWFVSLILLCYAVSIPVRAIPWLGPVAFVVSLAVAYGGKERAAFHLASFMLGMMGSRTPFALRTLILVVLAGLAQFVLPGFWYPFAAGICVEVGRCWQRESNLWTARAADATYEFYLVHGPIYVGMANLLKWGMCATTIVGTLVACIAAVVLDQLVQRIFGAWISQKSDGGRHAFPSNR